MPPEVKVRLSVEGTPEALAAFRSVQAQAQATGRASGRAFAPLSGALSGIKGLLAGAAAAFSAAALLGLGKQVVDNVEKLGRLAIELGTTVEHMSGLSVAATLADSDVDTLSKTMGLLTKNVDALKNGAPAATAAFARLGLTAKSFEGQDPAKWFETVAIRLGKIADGGPKAASAMAIMGKSGRQAIPIMQEVVKVGGLLGAEAQALRLGVWIDSRTLGLVRELGDSMKILKLEAAGAALQFARGFGPSAAEAMENLSGASTGAANSFRALGEIIGTVVRLAAAAWDIFFTISASLGAKSRIYWDGITSSISEAMTGRFAAAGATLRRMTEDQQALADSVNARLKRDLASIFKKPQELPDTARASARAAVEDEEDKAARARADAAAAATLARKKQALEDELKLTLAGLRAQEEAAKQSYDRGATDLGGYYAKRREVAEAGFAAEIAALDKQWDLSKQERDPAKRAADQDRIAAAARMAAFEIEQALAKITAEEYDAINGLSEAALQTQMKLLEAQGKTHDARMLQIAIEVVAERTRLAHSGLKGEELEAAVDSYRRALIAANAEERETTGFLQDEAAALQSGFASFFGSTITGFRSATEAARGFLLMLAQITMQVLASRWATTLFGGAAGKAAGGRIEKRAGGGRIYGGGTWTSDSVPILASRDEQMIRAAIASMSGVRPYLELLNAGEPAAVHHAQAFAARQRLATGGRVVRLREWGTGEQLKRLAAGGQVRGASGAGGGEFTGALTLNLPPGVTLGPDSNAIYRDRAGREWVLGIVINNRRTLRQFGA